METGRHREVHGNDMETGRCTVVKWEQGSARWTDMGMYGEVHSGDMGRHTVEMWGHMERSGARWRCEDREVHGEREAYGGDEGTGKCTVESMWGRMGRCTVAMWGQGSAQ